MYYYTIRDKHNGVFLGLHPREACIAKNYNVALSFHSYSHAWQRATGANMQLCTVKPRVPPSYCLEQNDRQKKMADQVYQRVGRCKMLNQAARSESVYFHQE